MLFQLHIGYKNGKEETKLVYSNDEDSVNEHKTKDMSLFSYNIFKYVIPKHRYLPKAIIRFHDKVMIYPEGVECHPKTSLEDIIEK